MNHSIPRYQVNFVLVFICAYTVLLFYSMIGGGLVLTLMAIVVPIGLIIGYVVVFQPIILVWTLVLVLPFSVNFVLSESGLALSFPGEILIFILTVCVILARLGRSRRTKSVNPVEIEFLRHPVTVAVGIYMGWSVLTAITSTMPMVSAKYVFVQFSFLSVFYWLFSRVFGALRDISLFIWIYALAMVVIIVNTIINHSAYDFVQQVNYQVPEPFFNDHTIYGACIAMLIPFFAGQLLIGGDHKKWVAWLPWLLLPLFTAAVLLTYSRGAWLSLVVMIGFVLLLTFRIRFKSLVHMTVVVIVMGIWQHQNIVDRLEQVNYQPGSDLKENALSTFNISTSITNVERINRWDAGVSMFFQKPILGFGPGTYQFKYGPFQDENVMTGISTRFGDKGGAHSEYIQSIAEMGLPGLIFFLIIIFYTIKTAWNLAYGGHSREVRILTASLILGLITYYIHSVVNNFLHTDKIAALFWGMTGFVVMLDVRDKMKSLE